MKFLCFIWRFKFLSVAFFSKAASESILYHSHALTFGKFYDWDYCPTNSYANGFEVKSDIEEKNFSDEEGMTGLRLRCANEQNEETHLISSYSNVGGTWKGMRRCPPGNWLTGFRIKIQDFGWWTRDDTGANDIEMACNKTRIYDGGGTKRGKWTEWNKCENDDVICGIRTKVEDVFTADRVGLVAVLFKCCDLDFNKVTESEPTEFVNTFFAPQATKNPGGFSSPVSSSESDEDSSSSSTRSQSSGPNDSQFPGVTRARNSDSTESFNPQFSVSTESPSSDSTRGQLPFPFVPRGPDSSSESDEDSSSFSTRSQSSGPNDSQFPGVTRSYNSDSTDSFSTESRLTNSFNPQFSVSTESQSSDSTRGELPFPFAPRRPEFPNSQSSLSTGSQASYTTESQLLDSANSQPSVQLSSVFPPLGADRPQVSDSSDSFSNKFSVSTESQFPGSNEFDISKSTESSSSASDEFKPSEYTSNIPLGNVFTTLIPRSSTQREIIFPEHFRLWVFYNSTSRWN